MWRSLALLPLVSLLVCASATAQQVAFNGSLGAQAAVLVIDGQPRTMRVGETLQGVRLVSMEGGNAVIETNGARRSLRLGATQSNLGYGGGGSQGGRQIVLSAGSGGHFTALGSINGRATQFLVDTGATAISIGQQEAEAMDIKFRNGRRIVTQTANGQAAAYLIVLASVRIGDVEVNNVDAIVIPGQMSHVLLGNSFLSRFQMRRDNDILTLDLRY